MKSIRELETTYTKSLERFFEQYHRDKTDSEKLETIAKQVDINLDNFINKFKGGKQL